MSELSPARLLGLGQSQPDTPTNAASILLDSDLAVMTKRFDQYMVFDQEKSKFMSVGAEDQTCRNCAK